MTGRRGAEVYRSRAGSARRRGPPSDRATGRRDDRGRRRRQGGDRRRAQRRQPRGRADARSPSSASTTGSRTGDGSAGDRGRAVRAARDDRDAPLPVGRVDGLAAADLRPGVLADVSATGGRRSSRAWAATSRRRGCRSSSPSASSASGTQWSEHDTTWNRCGTSLSIDAAVRASRAVAATSTGGRAAQPRVADFRRLYDFTGRPPHVGRGAQPARAIDTRADARLRRPAAGTIGSEAPGRRERSNEPGVPQSHAGAQGGARLRAGDARVPRALRRDVPLLDRDCSSRSGTASSRRSRAGSARWAWRTRRCGSTCCARPSAGRLPARRRRRADPRGDVPPDPRGSRISILEPSGWTADAGGRGRAVRDAQLLLYAAGGRAREAGAAGRVKARRQRAATARQGAGSTVLPCPLTAPTPTAAGAPVTRPSTASSRATTAASAASPARTA